jgi:hypothetical protein
MKKFVLILSAILLISLLIVSFAQEKYEPVSEKERELLKQGYKVVEFTDIPYDKRPIYFKDGAIVSMPTIKRIVEFETSRPVVKSLGAGYGEWSMETNEKIKLTLFYVIRPMKVEVTKLETREVQVPVKQLVDKEVKIPVSLEIKVDKLEKKTPIGKETK